MAGGKAIVHLMLSNESRVHSIIGLSALELQGIDNETVVLVVEERLSKSDRSITYGLILDLAKLRMDVCATLTEKGLLFFLENRALWTPKHIQGQWDQIDEVRNDNALAVQVAMQTNIEQPLQRREPKNRNPSWHLLERRL